MLRRPPNRTVNVPPTSAGPGETKFVSQLIELEQTGEVCGDKLPHELNKPGTRTVRIDIDPASDTVIVYGVDEIRREDLPDWLFESEPAELEAAPDAPVERWSDPFAGGVALSDKLMSYGRPTVAPIDNLPHSAMRRGRKHGSA